MAIEFSEAWRAAHPEAAVGILVLRGVANTAPGQAFQAELAALERSIRDRHAGRTRRDLEVLPALRPYLEHYRRFGKTYHVLLQLESVAWRGRALAGPGILVGAMFAAEVESGLLTAGHDLDAVRGPLLADVTRRGERYLGIGNREVEVRPGDLSIRDAEGIISSVLYGPDQRTRLTPATRAALFTTYAPGGIARAEIERHLREVERLIRVDSPSASTDTLEVRRPG